MQLSRSASITERTPETFGRGWRGEGEEMDGVRWGGSIWRGLKAAALDLNMTGIDHTLFSEGSSSAYRKFVQHLAHRVDILLGRLTRVIETQSLLHLPNAARNEMIRNRYSLLKGVSSRM